MPKLDPKTGVITVCAGLAAGIIAFLGLRFFSSERKRVSDKEREQKNWANVEFGLEARQQLFVLRSYADDFLLEFDIAAETQHFAITERMARARNLCLR